jgi:hypothetical protein
MKSSLYIILFSLASATGSIFADSFPVEDEFVVSPVYLQLKSDDDKNICEICIAGVRNKNTKKAAVAVSFAGPQKSCPGDPKDYNDPASREKGLVASGAKFEGDPYQAGELDGQYWLYKTVPGAIYYRTDSKAPGAKEKWSQFAVSLIYLDPRDARNPADGRMKILPFKPKRTEEEGGYTKVVAGNVGQSIQDKLTAEKPRFIGDLSELAKLAAASGNGDGSKHAVADSDK